MILFSVVIAVYNVEKYLSECIESVIGQTYNNWELILVDDGSTDESATICDEYAEKDDRIKVIHKENSGSFISRRQGISYAGGDYILVMDSDDIIHKDLLYDANNILYKNKYSMFIYRMKWGLGENSKESRIIYSEGTVLDIHSNKNDRKKLWRRVFETSDYNNLCLKIFSKDCLNFDRDYSIYDDLKSGTDMVQSLFILEKVSTIYFSEKAYYYYRRNTGGISDTKKKAKSEHDIDIFFENRKMHNEIKLGVVANNIEISKDMLEQYYANNFKVIIETVANWFVSVNRVEKKRIIVAIFKQDYFDIYLKNIDTEKLSLIYKKIYEGILEKNENKFDFWMRVPIIIAALINVKVRMKL